MLRFAQIGWCALNASEGIAQNDREIIFNVKIRRLRTEPKSSEPR